MTSLRLSGFALCAAAALAGGAPEPLSKQRFGGPHAAARPASAPTAHPPGAQAQAPVAARPTAAPTGQPPGAQAPVAARPAEAPTGQPPGSQAQAPVAVRPAEAPTGQPPGAQAQAPVTTRPPAAPTGQPPGSQAQAPVAAGLDPALLPGGAAPADAPAPPPFFGPPEPPWLVGPPEPPWLVGPPEPPWLVGPPAPGIAALAEGLYVATGFGGNVVARVTPEGVVVAGELTANSGAIAAWIASVTDQPVRYVLRTQRHGREPADLPAAWRNATLVAPERRAENDPPAGTGIAQPTATPSAPDPGQPPPPGSRNPPAPPDLAFTRGLSLFLGEAEIQFHHFAPAHTGRDAVVLFPDLGVLYAGDLIVRGMPFIDYAAGGSSRGWVEALDGILALDFETVVPGAGPALTKRDAQVFRDRFVTLRMRVLQLLYRDVAPENALPLLPTADLDWPLAPGGPFAAQSFARLYDELALERVAAREAAAAESDAEDEDAERP